MKKRYWGLIFLLAAFLLSLSGYGIPAAVAVITSTVFMFNDDFDDFDDPNKRRYA